MRWAVPIAAALLTTVAVRGLEALQDQILAQTVIVVTLILVVAVVGVLSGRDGTMPLLVDPFFLLCVFLGQFYILGPFAIRAVRIFSVPFAYKYAPERQIQALFAFLLFLIAAVIGHKLTAGRQFAASLPDFRGRRSRLSGAWAEAFLLGLGVLGCFGWILAQGGLSAKIAEGYGQGAAGLAIFRIAFVAVQTGTLLLAWRVFSLRRSAEFSRIALWGVLAFQALFFGLLLGMRKYLLFIFFGLLTLWVLRRGTASIPKLRVGAAFAVLLVFFSFWGTVRNRPLAELIEGTNNPMYADSGPLHQGYLNAVGGPFEVACLVYEIFPEPAKFRHGSTLLVTLLGFIPRAVWPDKPIGIGKEITEYIVGPFYEPLYGFSVTVTLPADLYLNFGWLGIVLGGLLAGTVCRIVSTYAMSGSRGGVQTVAARGILPAAFVMCLGEVRADMSVTLMAYVLTFIPLLTVFVVFRVDLDPATTRDGEATG